MSTTSEQLQRATEELAEAHRRTQALAFFARRVSHDLSNFLTVVRTYSELLLADAPADSTSRADLEEIRQAADTTVAYMQRASLFGRANTAPLAPSHLDGFVTAVVAQANAAGRGPITLRTESGAQVTASVAGLSDTLLELLINAREASPDGADITVHTTSRTIDTPIVDGGVPIDAGRWAIVSIMDDGPGVDPTIADSAFDPFVTTKAGVRGAGLGLTIARATAWAAQGQLVLAREGAHTVARLYLPISDAG